MKALMALALIAPLAACATMARGRTQDFNVASEPSGARVDTSTGLSCPATPCALTEVSREAEFTVTLTLSGYRPASFDVTHETSAAGAAAMAGTIALPGGLLLSLIDANFGATQDLTPNPLTVTLEPEGEAAPAPASAP